MDLWASQYINPPPPPHMTQLCRGFSATKNSPPSRTKRTLPIKLLRLTHPYHLYRSPINNQAVPLRQKPVWSISFAYAAACGCTDNKEWSAEASRGSGTTTTLLASPRYAYSSSPLQDLSYCCTYGLIWCHLCLFIFRKINKPLDFLVFQLLVMVGSFVAWPVLCVRENCESGWIFEIVGLERVEAFLLHPSFAQKIHRFCTVRVQSGINCQLSYILMLRTRSQKAFR